MTLKTIWAVIACTLLAAMLVLAVNPPEGGGGSIPPIILSGPTNACLGSEASYACEANEWSGWSNAVSYTWIVDGATNSCPRASGYCNTCDMKRSRGKLRSSCAATQGERDGLQTRDRRGTYAHL